jgi:DUF1680 family protein
VLNWSQRKTTITQTTTYPLNDTTSLQVTGTGDWTMKIRIPSWTSGASILINGQKADGVDVKPSTYASLKRSWKTGDTVTVKLPMKLRVVPANDDPKTAAVAYGPVVLSGNYGNTALSSVPTLALDSIKRSGGSGLAFTGIANGKAVDLTPFYDAHGFNYNVYWAVSGSLPVSV